MINVNKLKGKAVEKGVPLKDLADCAGITLSTLYRRLAEGGEAFTVKEVTQISTRLGLLGSEVNDIFLPRLSHNMRKPQ